eukprot:16412-Chlamydomonas_euryale.AAC.1
MICQCQRTFQHTHALRSVQYYATSSFCAPAHRAVSAADCAACEGRRPASRARGALLDLWSRPNSVQGSRVCAPKP